MERLPSRKRVAANLESSLPGSPLKQEEGCDTSLAPISTAESAWDSTSAPEVSVERQSKRHRHYFDQNRCKAPVSSPLRDQFELGRVLGKGHFGVVRRCREKSTGRLWACKTLRRASMEKRKEVEREIRITQLLTGHQNVVGLKGVHEDQGRIHLVLELCRGGELFHLINAVRRFSEPDAAAIFSQLTEVVAFCHAMGVMHRDIKPENILLVDPLPLSHGAEQGTGSHGSFCGTKGLRDVKIKLADFGLALLLEADQKAEGIAGSPLYLAPEVLSGSYGHSADVWSLGVILYILLSGTAPFCGNTDGEILEQIEAGHLAFSDPVWRSVSKEAIDLLRGLLCVDVEKRLTAMEAWSHPWLLRYASTPPQPGSLPCDSLETLIRHLEPGPAPPLASDAPILGSQGCVHPRLPCSLPSSLQVPSSSSCFPEDPSSSFPSPAENCCSKEQLHLNLLLQKLAAMDTLQSVSSARDPFMAASADLGFSQNHDCNKVLHSVLHESTGVLMPSGVTLPTKVHPESNIFSAELESLVYLLARDASDQLLERMPGHGGGGGGASSSLAGGFWQPGPAGGQDLPPCLSSPRGPFDLGSLFAC